MIKKINYQKPMRIFIFICVCSGVSFCVNGQADEQAMRALRAKSTMTQFSDGTANYNSGGLYAMAPSTPVMLVGDPYWDAHFGVSSVELKGRKELVEGKYVRYDIYKNEFEFLLSDGVKVMGGNKVVSVVWQDSLFSTARFLVSASQFKINGVPLTGFIELLVDNKISLFKRIAVRLKKPSYNMALDVGDKDSKILREELYYYAIDNALFRLKSKKDLKEISSEHQSKVYAYIKEKKIKFSSERDLILLIEYMNALGAPD